METRRQRLMIMLAAGWPVLALLVTGGRYEHWVTVLDATPGQVVGRIVYWAVAGAALSATMWLTWERWFSKDERPQVQVGSLVVLCLLAGLGFALAVELREWPIPAHAQPPGPGGGPHEGPPFWVRAVAPILSMYAWTAVHSALEAFQRLARERERALKAESLAAEARLAMLQYELNPHFLFNALNSIIGVIDEEPPRAQEMVRQLAGLLRHTLHSPPASTLGAELRVARQYLAIEQVRFEERLQVEVDVPDALLGAPAPTMLLQPLVENAVKHGMDTGVLTVRIDAVRDGGTLIVRVQNRGRLKNRGGGVGLRNLQERLQADPRGGHVEIEQRDDQVVATVTLPLEAP